MSCGRGGELVVGDHRAEGLAAELPVLRRVDVLVQAGLGDLGGVLEVGEQVVLRDVEDLDLDVLAEVGAVDEELEPAPGRLQLLHLRVVEDLVDLPAHLRVELGDHVVDDRLVDLAPLRGAPARA